ncbi:glycosyl transferase family 1 [Flavobacterium aquariorum]|uniref:Glycosyl transferase family 1 n=1 Tax=Flavobacterium aquariorum TaxID=2217670 RepID=A0A2W7TS88_9FLAO|nr:glycosyl transferase family 1 [Flavobacterium aquariorum]PZX92484.1 glycosyl transferase family 1 [Flavobacterium aquariorum]
MESKLLILAPYPTSENNKDGMISRVKAIDTLFENIPRTYLYVSLRSFIKAKKYSDGIVEVNSLNLLIHFRTILKLIYSHQHIYSHSIYMLTFLWLFISKKQTSMTLDLHGVVPEEEKYFGKTKIRAVYYDFIETQIFKRLTNAICVTDAMKAHYQNKYKWFTGTFLTYSIIPDNLQIIDKETVKFVKEQNNKKIHVIYSGGAQSWQNIDLMMQIIRNNQSPEIYYTILTGDKKIFEDKIKNNKINPELITVVSRNPSDLWKDYIAADYAFILRDENIVNRVACPTKLVEYLFYGLIPVVLSEEIGDYKKLGYDYFKMEIFSQIKKPMSVNENNINIAKKIIKVNQSTNLAQFILKS